MRKRIGQVEIGYDTQGSGEPLVLLHAFPLSRALWEHTAAELSRSCRVISMDLRGFGDSELGGAYSLADLSDDVSGLLDALSIDRAAVCGMSMGGYVALAFAMRHRSRLSGLVLADTRASADSDAARQGREQGIALIRKDGPDAFIQSMIPKLLSRQASPALQGFVRSIAERRPESLIAAQQAMRDRPDRTPELPFIKCPVLLLVGSEDVLSPQTEMRGLADGISGSRFMVLPGAGHLSNLEAGEAFSSTVADFVTGL